MVRPVKNAVAEEAPNTRGTGGTGTGGHKTRQTKQDLLPIRSFRHMGGLAPNAMPCPTIPPESQ
eukprot:15053998-Alexandrium_andersonii.AAC.1